MLVPVCDLLENLGFRFKDALGIPRENLFPFVGRYVVSPIDQFMEFRSNDEDPGNEFYH